MRTTRTRVIVVAGLMASAMALTACSTDTASTPAPTAAAGAVDLAAAGCPADIKIQTDWNPEAEHGHLYNLFGDDYTVDANLKTVTGPLVSEGKPTGVNVTILAGGPAVGFAQPNAQLYSDDSIFMAYVGTDEAIAHSGDLPTVGVFAPLEKDPQMIMWDPATYPDVKTIADLGKKKVTIRVFGGGTYMDYFVGAGIISKDEVDATYDGLPAVFVSEGGKIAQQGFASAEPYIYKNEIKDWGKDVAYQLINDAGYPKYAAVLSVRPDDVTKYSDCLKSLVPVLQKAAVSYYADPAKANKLILDLVAQYNTGWVYSQGVADYSVATQLKDGLVGNGPDDTMGNLDDARVQSLFDIVVPIYTKQGAAVKEGLKPTDIYTNEFIDPTIKF